MISSFFTNAFKRPDTPPSTPLPVPPPRQALDWRTFYDNKQAIINSMLKFGGSFAQALATLLLSADSERLKRNFLANIDTISEYGPSSPLFIKDKTCS